MQKKRVAAYCRISSELDGQVSSMALQMQVYESKIKLNPEWEFAGVYADEGITGTNMKKRTQFLQMIEDAKAGKIDILLTKSISRFARNTVECLEVIRQLQGYGVQIHFEKEDIKTGEALSEMILTILAAFAQEESRSLSENLKWGIRKRYEQGIDRWVTVYGYTSDENGKYQIVPEEADVVKAIYKHYEHGATMQWIADFLMEKQILSPYGKQKWTPSAVKIILSNEKYVGDIKLQKKYTVDHIEHKEIKNDGKVPSYYIKDHHTPIVDRKTYDRVQKIREMRYRPRRKVEGKIYSDQYPFGEQIQCPYCNRIIRKRKIMIQDNECYYLCEYPDCGNFMFKTAILEKAIVDSYNHLNMKIVKKKVTAESTNIRYAAELTIRYKEEYPTMEKADFYWIDDLIEKIEIGKHTMMPVMVKTIQAKGGYIKDDRTVTVYWKCGVKTTIFSGVEDDKDTPQIQLSLYRAKLERERKS